MWMTSYGNPAVASVHNRVMAPKFTFDYATGRWRNNGPGGQGEDLTEQQRGSVERTLPTAQNPSLGRWRSMATAGMEPGSARYAAAGQRATMRGMAALGRQAPGYWTRLMDLATQYETASNGVPVTSSGAAFLGGFLQGGGAAGLGSLAGSYVKRG